MRWLGQMQRAFELMCNYSLKRVTFGTTLAQKQTVQNWIADSAAEIQAARLLTLHAAKIDQAASPRRDQPDRSSGEGAARDRSGDQVHGARGRRPHAAREDVPPRALRPDLRRTGRGSPHGRLPPHPEADRLGSRLGFCPVIAA
jgi:alkylation response protein AidB-like acyl-CoA dehydrogenase